MATSRGSREPPPLHTHTCVQTLLPLLAFPEALGCLGALTRAAVSACSLTDVGTALLSL